MLNRALSNRRLLLMTLGLMYIAMGMLGALPGASLIQLARNTHVSLEVAGGMFTSSSFSDLLGAALSGFLMRSIKPKYLLMLGLFLIGSGSTTTALTSSFLVLLLGQMLMGLLIPALGINWVMAIPALCCALIFLPMVLANRAQPRGQTDRHFGLDKSFPLCYHHGTSVGV